MAFFSLLVREHKKGWIIGAGFEKQSDAMNNYMQIVKDAKYRAIILVTDGNVRNINGGLNYVKEVDGKGISRVFGFQRLNPTH